LNYAAYTAASAPAVASKKYASEQIHWNNLPSDPLERGFPGPSGGLN